jgi:hypothetical protein
MNEYHGRKVAMERRYCLPGAVGLVLILLLSGTGTAEDACRWEPPDHLAIPAPEPAAVSGDRDVYTGTIRVYVTETGRWKDHNGKPFHHAFLGFALEEYVSVNETQTLTWDLEWDGNDYEDANGQDYGDLRQENVKVIAAVFNPDGYPGYSDPPSGGEFVVHEVDATAGAVPGETGYNVVSEDFTHTVFVEDGSTTW